MTRFISIILMTFVSFGFEFTSVYAIKAIMNYFNGETDPILENLELKYIGIIFLTCKFLSFIISRQIGMYMVINLSIYYI